MYGMFETMTSKHWAGQPARGWKAIGIVVSNLGHAALTKRQIKALKPIDPAKQR